jgi:hypothetical protein
VPPSHHSRINSGKGHKGPVHLHPVEYAERDRGRPLPPVGARIRLTGEFLRNTGQIAGGEGGGVWKRVACACDLCQSGRFVAVDEKSVYAEPGEPRNRHIAAGNVEDVDRLARLEKEGREKLLENEKRWKPFLEIAQAGKENALRKHGRGSVEFERAEARLDFINITRARAGSDEAYREATGEWPWEVDWRMYGPLDKARALLRGAPDPGGLDEIRTW